MSGVVISRSLDAGGTSSKVAMTVASAKSAAFGTYGFVAGKGDQSGGVINLMLTTDALCFIRQGPDTAAAPLVALADGTDGAFAVGTHRVTITPGNKLAAIVPSGTGNLYITPEV